MCPPFCQVITPDSPIYDLNKSSLGRSKFEIIVTLEGMWKSAPVAPPVALPVAPPVALPVALPVRYLVRYLSRYLVRHLVRHLVHYLLLPCSWVLGYSARELDENNSMSAPEIIFSSKESQHHPRASTSPGLVKSLSAFHLPTLNREHEGDIESSTRHNSHVDLNLISEIAEILKPPSPSLAHAVSSHTFDSMQAMVREYEHNMRRLSRVSLDMGSHQQHAHHAAPSRRDSSSHHDQLHRSGSPLSMRRIGVNSFAIPPIEEDEQEVQITKF
ncbi:hypothetical protein BV898_13244 [Hypsibius exemplaris]|uniref:Inward rectifier potassium channel C-terminal domain-containing protein n=1 Tax=Hypsibius exemplaris TaxID=2072580 RepID=A0A1W0WBG5_HYPEX|nr:hypothetical protein BV898_13244 [Hypsibius exemplaris]